VPKLNEIYAKYKDKGFVLIGVHSDPDSEKAKTVAAETKIAYPVALDPKGALMKTFGCDSFPDYVIIDRKGIVRVVDLANAEAERAVEALINEK